MQNIEQLYKIYLAHPKIVTDSRKIEPGCFFFALKGERFNGNQFAEEALQQGAAFALIDEARYQLNDQCILVEDSLKTMQQLATFHRQKFLIPVLAITGSNGKTTTKELISAVLSSHYKTHFTRGNFNNHIGVPLTLLAMPANTEVAIIEMGANHQGEIAFLCEIARPTHGLITNIGKAHLEGFGGMEGVKKGKSELYRFLAANNGVAFINQDEPFLEALAKGIKWKIFYKQGETPTSDDIPFEVQLLAESPFIKATFASDKNTPVIIESRLIGQYNFNNIMTAAVLGTYFKVPDNKIKTAIENYVPSDNRSQLVHIDSNVFILDAYNANPTSMRSALQTFKKMNAPKKIAILGAMKELGPYAQQEHQEMIDLAAQCGFEKVILIGKEFRELTDQAFENVEAFQDWFKAQTFQDTCFLLKGSRSLGLEKLLEVQPG